MDDLISRQAAIDAFDGHFAIVGRNSAERFKMYIEAVINDIRKLPPAQLGTNLAGVGTDCISRQAAIDALKNDMASLDHIIKGMSAYDVRLDAYVSQRNQVNCDIDTISNLPTAQPGELDTLIKALEAEHKKLREMQKGTQPEIIYCKDCVKHNKGVGDFEVLPDGRRSWIWKDRACPLVSWRGKAQGHEFDYQYCVYAERRTDERSDCCDCYSDGRCVGTKEIDPCSCGGNKSKCDFYENVRREGNAE